VRRELNFQIKRDVGESNIIGCFNDFFTCGVNTMGSHNRESIFLLHCSDSPEGFRWFVLLSWKGDVDEFDELALARHVVSRLQTEVMFEPNSVKLPVPLEYVFMNTDGRVFAADYLELEDGIDVLPGSLIPLYSAKPVKTPSVWLSVKSYGENVKAWIRKVTGVSRMHSITLDTFRTDGSVLRLYDLLEVIPENDWVWSVFEFQGVGWAPFGLSMDEYEVFLSAQDKGNIMAWRRLLEFAQSMEQTFNCLIVAVDSVAEIIKPPGLEIALENYVLVVEAFDSAHWKIWTDRAETVRVLSQLPNVRVLNKRVCSAFF